VVDLEVGRQDRFDGDRACLLARLDERLASLEDQPVQRLEEMLRLGVADEWPRC